MSAQPRIARSSAIRRGKAGDAVVRRERQSAETTEKSLVDAARRVFADKGYLRTTVQDILDATGVSRGAFYLYFRNADDLFMKMIEGVVEELIVSSRVRSGNTLRERVYDGNLRYLEVFAAHRGEMRALFEASYVNPDIANIQNRMRSAYQLRVRDHLVRQSQQGRCHPIDPDSAAYALGMMVENAAQARVVLGLEPFERPLPLDTLCAQLTDTWCRAVYLDPDRPLASAPLTPTAGPAQATPSLKQDHR